MKKKTRFITFFLMLDLRFKNLCLMFLFIEFEQSKAIVGKYDRKTTYPMLLQCYRHLRPLFEYVV